MALIISEGEAVVIQIEEAVCYPISKVLPNKKVLVEWVFILMNVGIELCQAVLSQAAGEHKIKGNLYRRLAAIFSSACLTLSLFEVAHEAKTYGGNWQRIRGWYCYCFYYPSGKIFGRFSLWFGLISAALQLSLNIASLVMKRGVLKFDYVGLLLSVGYLIAALLGDGDKRRATINSNDDHRDVEAEGMLRNASPLYEGGTPPGSLVEIENHRQPEQLPQLRRRRQPGQNGVPYFERKLNQTDVTIRLAWPLAHTNLLLDLNDSADASFSFTVVDLDGIEYKFKRKFRRSRGYLKPEIVGEWLMFVRKKNLQRGDKVAFYKHEDDPRIPFTVAVSRITENNAYGPEE